MTFGEHLVHKAGIFNSAGSASCIIHWAPFHFRNSWSLHRLLRWGHHCKQLQAQESELNPEVHALPSAPQPYFLFCWALLKQLLRPNLLFPALSSICSKCASLTEICTRVSWDPFAFNKQRSNLKMLELETFTRKNWKKVVKDEKKPLNNFQSANKA